MTRNRRRIRKSQAGGQAGREGGREGEGERDGRSQGGGGGGAWSTDLLNTGRTERRKKTTKANTDSNKTATATAATTTTKTKPIWKKGNKKEKATAIKLNEKKSDPDDKNKNVKSNVKKEKGRRERDAGEKNWNFSFFLSFYGATFLFGMDATLSLFLSFSLISLISGNLKPFLVSVWLNRIQREPSAFILEFIFLKWIVMIIHDASVHLEYYRIDIFLFFFSSFVG